MFSKNVKKNCQMDLTETMKILRKSISSIMQTINSINARPEKAGEYEQFMLEDIHGLLQSLCSMLQYSYKHAKNQDEFNYVKQTHDLVNQTFAELNRQILILK